MHIQANTGASCWQRTPPTQEQIKSQASDLFSKLDSSNKGYLDQADFSAALQSLATDSSDDQSSQWFSQLDGDADGKLTSEEFSSAVSEQLYNARGGMAPMPGMRPPPPKEQDGGKSVDELTQLLDEVKTTDSAIAADLQRLIDQFDSADADQDGKVSHDEAMAFKDSQQPTSRSSDTSQQQLQQTLLQLMKSYGAGMDSSTTRHSVSLSV